MRDPNANDWATTNKGWGNTRRFLARGTLLSRRSQPYQLGVDMKRIDEWEQFWSESQPASRIERFAPLVAFGIAAIIAWL